VDLFVIYDDVNYIKQGWINRNRILLNEQPYFITLRLKDASSFKKINEIEINADKKTILKTVHQAYTKAPYFSKIYPLVESIMSFEENNLAKFVSNSINEIVKFIGIKKIIVISSESGIGRGLKSQGRILEICKHFNGTHYINAIGGQYLYDKIEFEKSSIELKFLKTNSLFYKQFSNEFVPWLSIIDVLMFNSGEEIKKMLDGFELI